MSSDFKPPGDEDQPSDSHKSDQSFDSFAETNLPSEEAAKSDSQKDRYLHPVSLVFSLLKQIRSNVIPAIFGVLGAANGELIYIIIALVFLIPSIVYSFIRYFTVRYRIANGELVVNEGLLFRRTRTVPISKIQNIDLVQGVLHRFFKVAEVRVETASGTRPEAILRVLSLKQVDLLRRDVFEQKSNDASTDAPTDFSNPLPSANAESTESTFAQDSLSPAETSILTIPTSWLAKAGFASNRGFIMVGVLIGLYLQFDRRSEQDYDFSFLAQWMPATGNIFLTFAMLTAAGLAALILLRMLGVGWYILRFFGYQLQLSGDDFKISCGLLTKVSATVPRKRIQFISIHSNFFSRLMGLASIRIETAGGASSQNEDATTTVSRRWFVPVIPASDVKRIVETLRPEMLWQPETYDWQPLSPKAGRRMMRIAVVAALALGPIGYLYFGIWGCAATIVAMPVFLIYAHRKSKSVKFARTSFGVVYRSGILTQKISMTFFEKIQATAVDQTPFDRRWSMATLSVDTAAAGPANHAIEIGYLDAEFAKDEYQKILELASTESP